MEMANRDDLGMIWMGDMLLTHDSNEMMLDSQSGSPFFSDSPHPLEEMRGRVPLEMEGFPMLDEYDSLCEEAPRFLTSTATQTTAIQTRPPARKIKPIKHPGLKLKTPIAYQKDTDPSVIPIAKDGMAVCEQCGAIGVKHAFYTKERRFCSLTCAREFSEKSGQHNTKSQSLSYIPHMDEVIIKQEPKQEKLETIQSASELPPLSLDDPPSPVMMKRNRAELANTYDWRNQLSEPGFIAAPVSCFKHVRSTCSSTMMSLTVQKPCIPVLQAPLADCWENITVGMKVEVENTDCDDFTESFPDSFWVATVLRIAGYKALLRYEGFGQNNSKDFWVSLCSNSVHPVGWCATRGKPLIPPKTIEDKYKDWKEFLVKRLTGARTLPSNFYNKVMDSLGCRFRCGLNLEVVDKNRISQVKVAKIQRIVGKRLHVQYYDAEPDDNGFWCHEDSPLIHPVGWASRVGHAINAPQEYLDRCEDGGWNEDDATDQYFCSPISVPVPPGVCFQEGMKLEAIDPLNLSAICVATVMKVLRGDYVMIRIDSYDEDASGADWFCYHASSPCIFPAGFCDVNSIPLTPPKGYEPSEFDWSTYLEESNLTTAPLALFNREIPPHGFVEGMRLEAADLMDPRLVCVGTVSRVVGRLLKVHFDGWEEEYDQWLDCESPDMYPVGWCHLVHHKLEGPRTATTKALATTGKSPKGVKKKPRRRHKKARVSLGGGSGIKKTPNNNNLTPRAENPQIWLAKAVNIIGQEFSVRGTPPAAVSSGTNSNGSSSECMLREPAQATKAASTESCSEGLPKEASNGLPAPGCEPEMGQEPAGPDQSLPVSSEPTQSQQPPLPRERTATSYINKTTLASTSNNHQMPPQTDWTGRHRTTKQTPTSRSAADDETNRLLNHVQSMAASGKLIPRLIDSTGSIGEPGELVPAEWNVFDVAQFLRVNDCAAYCDSFSRRKIDGKTLLTLTKDQIIDLTGMKVGPSLKIFDLIQQLKIKINPAQERMKASLKKLL